MNKIFQPLISILFSLHSGLMITLFICTSVVNAENDEVWSGFETKALEVKGEKLNDADHDGVIDLRDDCENVNADAVISNEGCAVDKNIIAQTILDIEFKSDDWHVAENYFSELKRFANFYQQHAGAYITIEGHTDSTGNAAHNFKLSQLRAQAVVKLLTDRYGVDKHKISWVGYGETKPVADNKTKTGRKKNRRIVAVTRAHELVEIRNWSVH